MVSWFFSCLFTFFFVTFKLFFFSASFCNVPIWQYTPTDQLTESFRFSGFCFFFSFFPLLLLLLLLFFFSSLSCCCCFSPSSLFPLLLLLTDSQWNFRMKVFQWELTPAASSLPPLGIWKYQHFFVAFFIYIYIWKLASENINTFYWV